MKRGTRVRLSPLGRRQLGTTVKITVRHGRIAAKCYTPDCVNVLWDGLAYPQRLHRDFVEYVPKQGRP